jgi:alanyl-tRNA synthetase
MARERGLKVDSDKFDELMELQRQRARAAQKDTTAFAGLADTELPVTEDIYKYNTQSCDAKIVGFVDSDGFKTEGNIPTNNNVKLSVVAPEINIGITEDGALKIPQQVSLVLDKTCFYGESGGQVGDCGTIESGDNIFVVENTIKVADCVLHQGKVAQGDFKIDDTVTATVSKDRKATMKNHTATHLLQWALQKVVGESISQKGSLVCPDYLRFDFTCPKALTKEQISEVEKLVRQQIAADEPVTFATLNKKDAEKLGAMALFGEKYGDEVRVVAIGTDNQEQLADAFSKEFCGGTHVDNIGLIGGFKIIKEESISAGVRRITAYTGIGLQNYLDQQSQVVDQLSKTLKVPADQITERIETLIKDNKKLAKELKNASKQTGSDVLGEARKLLENAETIGDAKIVTGKLSDTNVEQARTAIDMVKKKAKSAVAVFGFSDGDKATLIAGVTDDLIKKGIKAGDIIKQIAPIVEGGGGGRPQMAQAGGKNPEKIDEALNKARELIKELL